MPRSIQKRLESVQSAIAEIESGDGGGLSSGQAVEIDGRSVARPDLETLYREERRLLRLKKRKERGGVRVRRGVPLDD